MTRSIQTALLVFSDLIMPSDSQMPVQTRPDMRAAHDAIRNRGISRAGLVAKFPQFDFPNVLPSGTILPTLPMGRKHAQRGFESA
jgi:hypothetical protein